jgi:predicted dehydrogenase
MAPKVLVCGAGSIGRRHIRNLQALGATPILWRARPELIDAARREFGIVCDADRGALLRDADAVVVATAPDSHMEIALEAAALRKPIFLEKPIAHDPTDVASFKSRVDRDEVPVEVGCQLRHHPSLQELARRLSQGEGGPVLTFQMAVGQRLDQWRPGTDHRAGFSADVDRGGGALFELVHDLDLARWFAGPVVAVSAAQASIGGLGVRGDDLSALTLTLSNGAVGQVQMDMVSPVYRRRLEIVCRDVVWRWDDADGTLWRIAPSGNEKMAVTPDGFQRNDLFLAHMRHFLDRVDDPTRSASCSLDDGIAVLAIALAARRSAAGEGRSVVPETLHETR